MKSTDTALKILHILDHSLPLHSGYSFRTLNIFKAQQKKGWTPIGLTSLKHELACGGSAQQKEIVEGFPFFRSQPIGKVSSGLLSQLATPLSLIPQIQAIIEAEQPDILHTHSPVLNVLPALWISRRLNIPVIYEIRAFWEDAAVDHGAYLEGSWKYRMVRGLESWVCKRVDGLILLCEGIRNDLLGRGVLGNNCAIVPNGINTATFPSSVPGEEMRARLNLNGKKVIGFIGSFYRYEGLEFLVKVFHALCRNRSDLILLLVGGGEVKTELENLVTSLGLDRRVIFPGRIPHERISEIYGLIDIFVYPRVPIRLTELVTPLKPLEAMMAGKPLVASDIGGHRELIKDFETGLLFPPNDFQALVEVLSKLLHDESLMRSLGERGRQWVEKERSWDQTTSGYVGIYEKALASKKK